MNETVITIITGFLGAGKTTFINRLLKADDLEDTIVVVNEFGDVGLDHLLVEGSDDTVLELSNGCVCCSIRGELIDTLLELQERKPQRIFVETTGIADPLPILQALSGHPTLSANIESVSVVTVVDGHRGFEANSEYEEFLQQIALADQILISKTDLIDEADIQLANQLLLRELEKVNIAADIQVLSADGNPNELKCFLFGDRQTNANPLNYKKGNVSDSHSTRYKTILLSHDRPISLHVISRLIENIICHHNGGLLRVKGLVFTVDEPLHPLVVNCVGNIIEMGEWLDGWGNKAPGTRLVVITKNVDPAPIERMFYSFVGEPQLDTPDYSAIENNPLAIPGT